MLSCSFRCITLNTSTWRQILSRGPNWITVSSSNYCLNIFQTRKLKQQSLMKTTSLSIPDHIPNIRTTQEEFIQIYSWTSATSSKGHEAHPLQKFHVEALRHEFGALMSLDRGIQVKVFRWLIETSHGMSRQQFNSSLVKRPFFFKCLSSRFARFLVDSHERKKKTASLSYHIGIHVLVEPSLRTGPIGHHETGKKLHKSEAEVFSWSIIKNWNLP